jgi:hypothetical protein
VRIKRLILRILIIIIAVIIITAFFTKRTLRELSIGQHKKYYTGNSTR